MCSLFVGLQQIGDHMLGVVGHVVKLGAVKLEASRRHVGHRLGVAVAHEWRQAGQPARTHTTMSRAAFQRRQENSTIDQKLRA